MRSKKARLNDLLAGLTLVDDAQWRHLLNALAPISPTYLRHLLRASHVPLTPEVEGVRQENFAELERTLLAATRAAVLEARRHAQFALRSPNVDRPVKQEMLEWMRVWLETPEAFPVWVNLRRATPAFRALQRRLEP